MENCKCLITNKCVLTQINAIINIKSNLRTITSSVSVEHDMGLEFVQQYLGQYCTPTYMFIEAQILIRPFYTVLTFTLYRPLCVRTNCPEEKTLSVNTSFAIQKIMCASRYYAFCKITGLYHQNYYPLNYFYAVRTQSYIDGY